jgi:hypothetical protein
MIASAFLLLYLFQGVPLKIFITQPVSYSTIAGADRTRSSQISRNHIKSNSSQIASHNDAEASSATSAYSRPAIHGLPENLLNPNRLQASYTVKIHRVHQPQRLQKCRAGHLFIGSSILRSRQQEMVALPLYSPPGHSSSPRISGNIWRA